MPDAIAAKVVGVIGLTNSIQYAPLYQTGRIWGENIPGPEAGGGTCPKGYYAPGDLHNAYDIPSFGDAVPQTFPLFEAGGFILSDIKVFLKKFGLPEPPITFVSVNSYNGAANGVIGEVTLDIDMVIGINPNVKQVLVYAELTPTAWANRN